MSDFLYYQYHAKVLIPESLKGEIYSLENKVTYIDHVNKVNLFIGANNSGKSKIVRELLKEKNSGVGWSKEVIAEIKAIVENTKDEIRETLKNNGLDPASFSIMPFNQDNFFNSKIVFEEKLAMNYEQFNPDIAAFRSRLTLPDFSLLNNIYGQISVLTTTGFLFLGKDQVVRLINTLLPSFSKLSQELGRYEQPQWKLIKVYIPAIRTLRDLVSHNVLKTHINLKYKFESGTLIESGEDFYEFVISHRNTNPEKKKKLKAFEKFLSEVFFGEQSVELNFHEEDRRDNSNVLKIIYIKIGDQRELAVHDLGDGLQMIIILTFPFFQYDCGIVSIEEPELFIHPGLQRKVLDFFVNHPKTKNFQIFIATHSNHFIDAVNESELVSIFTVVKRHKPGDESDEKLPDFVIENVAYGNQDPLHLLGVNNSSVCLANCTIWVEGVSDRLYLAKYISEYMKAPNLAREFDPFKKYQEGVHYSFVFTAGDNIIHWDFDNEAEYAEISSSVIVKNLCGKAFVIVDDDFGKNPERKKLFEKLLGKNLLVLSVPEIENLLALEVIAQTVVEYPSVSHVGVDPLKTKDASKLESFKLGSFIDNVLLEGITVGKKFSNINSKEKASLNVKIDFCKKAVKHITYNNMTPKSKEVVEMIIRFVIQQNSKSV